MWTGCSWKIMFICIQFYNNWHNLSKQFPGISPTNFTILFSLENIKRETAIFNTLFWSGLSFSSLRKPGLWISRLYFYFPWHYELSLYKEACLHNLCMNRASLDRESLDRDCEIAQSIFFCKIFVSHAHTTATAWFLLIFKYLLKTCC